jgi:hypothetical protein
MAKQLRQFIKISPVHAVPGCKRVPEIVTTEILDTGEFQKGFETALYPGRAEE